MTTSVNLRPMASSHWPLTPDEIRRVEEIWSQFPGITPPYEGLSEDDAVLVQRYMTGASPFTAQVAVNRSRSKVLANP